MTKTEGGPQLTEKQRRLNLIAYVRDRIATNPDTLVSHRVRNPQVEFYSLGFKPDKDSYIKIEVFPEAVSIERKGDMSKWELNAQIIINSASENEFDNGFYEYGRAGLLNGKDALQEAEERIEEFLPPKVEQPA